MSRRRISSGSPFERDMAYSRAVVEGDWCFVAGTTGYDYAKMEMPDGVLEQAEAALTTIRLTLDEAGFAMSDVVRASYIVTDRAHRDAIAPALRAAFANVLPAATMIVCDLIDPSMKVEIEVTAVRQTSA